MKYTFNFNIYDGNKQFDIIVMIQWKRSIGINLKKVKLQIQL